MKQATEQHKDVFYSYGQWEEHFLNKDYEAEKKQMVNKDVSKESEALADNAFNHLIQSKP